jgi:hypothetical protein
MKKSAGKPKGILVRRGKKEISQLRLASLGESLPANFSHGISAEIEKRLDLIAKKYGYSMDDWNGLALALALDLEPSIQVNIVRATGAPTKWNHELRTKFFHDFDEIKKANPRLSSVEKICKEMKKSTKWKHDTLKSLRLVYERGRPTKLSLPKLGEIIRKSKKITY